MQERQSVGGAVGGGTTGNTMGNTTTAISQGATIVAQQPLHNKQQRESRETKAVEDPEIGAGGEPQTKVPLKIEDVIGALTMGALCLITFVNVVVRYFTDDSFAWTEEISIFLMVVMTLVAGAAAVARDRHIRIEYFFEGGSARRKQFLSMLSAFAILLLFAAMAILGGRVAYDDFHYGDTSPGIGIPNWIYTMWLPILSAVIALRALGVLIRKGRGK